MRNIPEDVKKYLVADEVVDKQFRLGDLTIFASANRIFIQKGSMVRDISFVHISSIETQVKRHWLMIVIGLALTVGIFYMGNFTNPDWASRTAFSRLIYNYGESGRLFYYFWGIILIVVGYIWKTASIKLGVAGLSEEQIFQGDENTLNALFRVINERRLQIMPNQPQRTPPEDNV